MSEGAPLPLVLLDVDGVLNAVTSRGDPAVWSDWQYGTAAAGGRRWRIVWSPTVTSAIRRWHETGLADVRWLTTWRRHANDELRRLLDLPELPVVGDDRALLVDVTPDPEASSHAELAGAHAASLVTGRWWKLDLVVELVRQAPARPFVWLDDDLRTEGPVVGWLRAHTTCLPLAPHPGTGLTAEHLRTAEAWLTQHRPGVPVADRETLPGRPNEGAPVPKRDPHPGKPGRFEDLPWRFRYRVRRALFQAFGPPQLGGEADPLWSLDREREQRLAERARRRAQSGG